MSRRHTPRFLRSLAFGWLVLPALAVTEPAVTPPPPDSVIYPRLAEVPAATASQTPGGGHYVLVAALVLAGAGGWMFWRTRTSPGGAAAVRQLSIAETKSLGNRQFLVVACYEGKKFLLGVCPGRIDLLTPLEGRPPDGGQS
jgi:flagellar protein FliO/FliZ